MIKTTKINLEDMIDKHFRNMILIESLFIFFNSLFLLGYFLTLPDLMGLSLTSLSFLEFNNLQEDSGFAFGISYGTFFRSLSLLYLGITLYRAKNNNFIRETNLYALFVIIAALAPPILFFFQFFIITNMTQSGDIFSIYSLISQIGTTIAFSVVIISTILALRLPRITDKNRYYRRLLISMQITLFLLPPLLNFLVFNFLFRISNVDVDITIRLFSTINDFFYSIIMIIYIYLLRNINTSEEREIQEDQDIAFPDTDSPKL